MHIYYEKYLVVKYRVIMLEVYREIPGGFAYGTADLPRHTRDSDPARRCCQPNSVRTNYLALELCIPFVRFQRRSYHCTRRINDMGPRSIGKNLV